MPPTIRDANLDLLIGLRRHLESADQLRAALDRLLSLAKSPTTEPASEPTPPKPREAGHA